METAPLKHANQVVAWHPNELVLLNTLPDALLIINSNNEIDFVNSPASDLLGYAPGELIGNPLKFILPDGHYETWDMCFEKLFSGSKTTTKSLSLHVELSFKKRNGDRLRADVLLSSSDIHGRAILLSLRDIDPYINDRLSTFIQIENQALKKELAARNAEITTANEEIDAFKFSLAHDLRSPLRIISGYTKIVEKKYESLLNDEAIELLDSIKNYSNRLNDLMSEMLSFSKLGKTELVVSSLDMTSIAQSAINELNADVRHQAFIKLNPLKPSNGDPFMMIRVFYNLLSNAVKYSAKTASPLVEISSNEVNGEIIYSVTDNGVGFDMKYEPMLYSLFYRLHDLNEYEGMGVGLAVVRRIIGRHGGKIWATSKPGGATTFNFTLAVV